MIFNNQKLQLSQKKNMFNKTYEMLKKRLEEVNASEDNYKKKQIANKLNEKMIKIGVPIYNGGGTYRKEVK